MENCNSNAPPALCFVCKRSSFLNCNGCTRTYCSAECQMQDWTTHRIQHKKEDPITQNQVDRALKVDIPKEADMTMEVDSIANRMENLEMGAGMVEIQNFFDRPMATITKFRRPLMIPSNIKDENDFFAVHVTSIELVDMQNIIYSVVLANMLEALTEYQQQLNEEYSDTSIPLVMSSEYAKSLMMAKIDGQWCRCIQKPAVDPKFITIEDIDTGKKKSVDRGILVKPPKKNELARHAFAFKIKLTNIFDRTEVDVGDNVKIRITHLDLRTVSVAEIETENHEMQVEEEISENDADGETEWKVDAPEFIPQQKKEEPPIFISELKFQNFPTGTQQVVYVDGSKIGQGRLTVQIDNAEVNRFYENLYDDIQKFVKDNENKSGYKPRPGELVLAIFHRDGAAYRAVCISNSAIDSKVMFVDYGSDEEVQFSEIWKMPKEFLVPCYSRTIEFKLKSGKSHKQLNFNETLEKLLNTNKFEGDIACLDGKKYSITIDDSLVVMK